MTSNTTYPDPLDWPAPTRVSRFNAWFFDSFTSYINVVTRPNKKAAFGGIEPGHILEIGAGTGANFTFVPSGARVTVLEPSVSMHERLQRRATEAGIDIELVSAPAELIPVEDSSVDTVLSSLVLCTVEDPDTVLSEILRILRPGGTLRFVEHVVAPSPWSPRRWLQRSITRPWAWLFEGCQLCRDTAHSIKGAGFSSVEIQRRRLRMSLFVPVNSTISGIATK